MAAAEQQSPDRVVPPESIDPLGTSVIASEEKSTGSQNSKKEIPSTKDEKKVSTSGPSDATSIDLPGDTKDQLGSLDVGADRSAVYQPNIYAPQLQTIYYGGYENPSIEWDDYSQFLNPEGMEMGSHGASLMFHTGYGYSPQMPYGPYSSVTTPLSSSNRDNQMYSTQQFTLAGPYFQQPGPSSTMPYLSSPTPVSQGNLTMLIGTEQQGFDGFGSARLWSDWLKSPDGQRSLTPFSPAASPQPSGGFGSYGHSVSHFSSGMDSPQLRHCGFGSSTISYDRGYSFGGMYHQGTNFGANQGMNTRGWIAMDKGTWRGKGNTGFCSCNGPLDLLSEQNRGPRATRSKNLASGPNTSTDAKNLTSADVGSEYNKPDFVTECKDAKFFVIKSYSEDNIHKSIKYGVWASTSNGNRKLDLAYREAKEKEAECPVFLFFSVNASGQFCGVAKMIGPVDFEKSVDYWQQDKWSGQFPVKWHIVKDVPNSLFRHIILENNGNKPVTNSRDTQEVTLEEGLKMLTIFKKHEAAMSILDDFDFYEERQRAMQERKALQQQQQQRQANQVIPSPAVLRIEQNSTTQLTGDLTSRMSKTFAQAVRLDEKKKEDPESGGKGSLAASSAKSGDLTVDSNRHADQLG